MRAGQSWVGLVCFLKSNRVFTRGTLCSNEVKAGRRISKQSDIPRNNDQILQSSIRAESQELLLFPVCKQLLPGAAVRDFCPLLALLPGCILDKEFQLISQLKSPNQPWEIPGDSTAPIFRASVLDSLLCFASTLHFYPKILLTLLS